MPKELAPKLQVATTYDAPGTYKESLNMNACGNTPPDVVNKARQIAIEMVALDPQTRKSRHPGFSQRVQNWPQFSKDQKFQFVAECTELKELKAFILVESEGEDNNELLTYMIEKKKELELI